MTNSNPNVALYALLVLESCVKNCGTLIHDEIATEQYMEYLKELVKISPHENVRFNTLELIQAWAHTFRHSLIVYKYKIVQDTLNIMKAEGHRFSALIENDTSREFDRVMAEYKASENKVKQLQYEKEQLEEELSELRSEKGLLDRLMTDANKKCSVLRDRVNKFKSECNGLREKIREHEAVTENLKFELEKAQMKLEDAAVNTMWADGEANQECQTFEMVCDDRPARSPAGRPHGTELSQ